MRGQLPVKSKSKLFFRVKTSLLTKLLSVFYSTLFNHINIIQLVVQFAFYLLCMIHEFRFVSYPYVVILALNLGKINL